MSIPKTHRLLATGILPDALIRWHVRGLCRKRLSDEAVSGKDRSDDVDAFVREISSQPIALEADVANMQHYEVSTDFFRKVLGKRMKYSCCLWPEEQTGMDLDRAEDEMLALTCRRAGIENGMEVLELGCGWGSVSLYVAEHFPDCSVIAVSNSATQKAYIDQKATAMSLQNIRVITADMNNFGMNRQFDRIISIEMFEHMRNWGALLSRVRNWLKTEGKLFVHIFTFEGRPYLYHAEDPEDWMARNFFASGMMPCPELMDQFSDILKVEKSWKVSGTHYQKTLEAWLQKMDLDKAGLFPVFRREYGADANKYWNHWRVFFMSCAEVFGYGGGRYWSVGHYLMG